MDEAQKLQYEITRLRQQIEAREMVLDNYNESIIRNQRKIAEIQSKFIELTKPSQFTSIVTKVECSDTNNILNKCVTQGESSHSSICVYCGKDTCSAL